MPSHQLSKIQYEQIRDHNSVLIDGLQKTVRCYKRVPIQDRPPHIQGQLDYCNHAIKALRWSTFIAQQRAGVAFIGQSINSGGIA